MKVILCMDEMGRVLGHWRCIELPIAGLHDGRWEWVEAPEGPGCEITIGRPN